MQLKSFSAKTVKEAMTMVRNALGEDAIIVSTREEKEGKGVRVTAAIERDDAELEQYNDQINNENVLAHDWFQADDIDDENALVEKLTDVMLSHSVPEEITDQVLTCATVLGMEKPDVALTAAIEHIFSFQPIPQKGKGTCYMLVGPPGAGKTLITAKLAARSVLSGNSTAVITTDTIKAGGIEQLAAFTKILKINLQRAVDVKELRECIIKTVNRTENIYIDTGAMSPFDHQEIKDLARLAAVAETEPILVMPAGYDAEESAELARAYGTLGIRYMIPTRLDFARRLGGILSAAHFGSLILADASHNSQVANGLVPLNPKRMTEFLMPEYGNTQDRNYKLPSTGKQREKVG